MSVISLLPQRRLMERGFRSAGRAAGPTRLCACDCIDRGGTAFERLLAGLVGGVFGRVLDDRLGVIQAGERLLQKNCRFGRRSGQGLLVLVRRFGQRRFRLLGKRPAGDQQLDRGDRRKRRRSPPETTRRPVRTFVLSACGATVSPSTRLSVRINATIPSAARIPKRYAHPRIVIPPFLARSDLAGSGRSCSGRRRGPCRARIPGSEELRCPPRASSRS